MKRFLLLIVLLISLGSNFIRAEENYTPFKIGLYASILDFNRYYISSYYDSYYTFGVVFHITPQIVIRPNIAFDIASDKQSQVIPAGEEYPSGDNLTIGGGCELQYFIPLNNDLAIYFGSGAQYVYTSDTYYQTNSSAKSDFRQYQNFNIPAKFGVQYMINRFVGLFGEMGGAFRYKKTSYQQWDAAGVETSNYAYPATEFDLVYPRLGITLYFN